LIDSLWRATAAEAAPALNRLEGEHRAQVVIIGGGFTGLSSAIHLRDRGIDVVVIEAEEIGWGASGRNGGQVIPGLKLDPADLVAKFGPERGERLADLAGRTADIVFGLIDRFQISCEASRAGWIQGAHSERALATVLARAETWAKRGAPVELLSRERIAALTGTTRYFGGWVDRRAGTVNPLAYCRGLARGALSLGARIFERSPATEIRRDGKLWRVATPAGAVLAEHVVVGTNAYTGPLWDGLDRSFLPVQSIQLATRPLGHNVGATILPGGECVSETRKLAFYFRRDAAGRLLMGGRGSTGDDDAPHLFATLTRAIRTMFPQLPPVELEHRWSGRVAITLDGLPHFHESERGIHLALGYNGRGIAMATVMGSLVAARVAGEEIPLPVTRLSPIPWHGMRKPLLAAGIAYHRLRDQLGFAS
jgi:glycine/D-amino acid oxidase-like deaminating enzyme